MPTKDLKGLRALVTGASSGIGADFARQLAARGADLVITARRADRLEALAKDLRERHAVEVTVEACDLARPEAAAELFQRTEGAGRPIDVLINNAGFGLQSYFLGEPWSRWQELLHVDITALTELSHRFGEAMARRKKGWILNVSSIGAYTPTPTFAVYAAAKAYVRNFTEALADELAPQGVRACCLCPGGTLTEFFDVAGQKLPGFFKIVMMSSERCARIGLSALFGWRRNVVAGFFYKLSMWMLRFMPRRMMVSVAKASMAGTLTKAPPALSAASTTKSE
jgi:short-subunit dehydrogenase